MHLPGLGAWEGFDGFGASGGGGLVLTDGTGFGLTESSSDGFGTENNGCQLLFLIKSIVSFLQLLRLNLEQVQMFLQVFNKYDASLMLTANYNNYSKISSVLSTRIQAQRFNVNNY